MSRLVSPRYTRARSLYKQACDGGSREGCANIKTP